MARVTPEEAADYQIQGIGAATEKMRKGIERVTKSPMEAAAAKKDKMLQRLTQSVQDGTWERGLRSVTLEQWKTAMIDKGLSRVATGAQAAKPKLVAFFSKFLPYVDSAKAEIAKMPDLTIEDSANRAAAWVRKMGAYKNK
jgi:hypothetical protein